MNEQAVKDYATMTDEQLNVEIAERLGWTEFEMGSYWLDDYFDTSEIHCMFGISPSKDRRPLPSWSHDLNAADALDFGDAVLAIRKYKELTTIRVFDSEKPEVAGAIVFMYQDSRPEPRVRTEAWLMYKDAQS